MPNSDVHVSTIYHVDSVDLEWVLLFMKDKYEFSDEIIGKEISNN